MMNILKKITWVLFIVVLIAQTYILTFGKEEPQTEAPPPSQYGVIGNCVDISDFIRDIENVNGISCDCIILDGEIIYFAINE